MRNHRFECRRNYCSRSKSLCSWFPYLEDPHDLCQILVITRTSGDIEQPAVAEGYRNTLVRKPRCGRSVAGLFRIESRENCMLDITGKCFDGVSKIFLRHLFHLLPRDRKRDRVGRTGILEGKRLDVSPRNEFIVGPLESLHPPSAEKTVKRSIHMNDDHTVVGVEQLNVVHDFCFAAA